MKISLISMDQAWENKQKNIVLCEEFIRKSANTKSDLIKFPEMTLTGFSLDVEKIAEKEESSITINQFINFAKKYNIAIIFGLVILNKDKAENRLIFLNNYGKILESYTKIHPFSYANEDKYFSHGSYVKSAKFKGHEIGLTICYDLRFSDTYSILSTECDIIINIANWPSSRKDHWETLLKARAIENQIFMIGVNRVGVDGTGSIYSEGSMVFNANGEKLMAETEKNMKTFTIDKEWTKNFKNNFNTTIDKKRIFYKENDDIKR